MKNWLSICALALSTTCLVSPAAFAQSDNPGKAPSAGTSAPQPPAATPVAPPSAEPAPAAAPAPVPEIPADLLKPLHISEFTLGMQWVGGRNTGQYGRYNGATYGGFDVLLGFEVLHRSAPDAEEPFYYSLTGDNIAFQTGSHLSRTFFDDKYTDAVTNRIGPNAEVNLSLGVQGKWGVSIGYNAITYTGNVISSLWSINGNSGLLMPTLLPMGGANNSPLVRGSVTAFTAPTLSPYFRQFETGTRRDQVDISGKVELDQWTLATHVQHESKKGSIEESIRQTWGGMAFAMPVDFDTDRFDVSASYVSADYQAVIQYSFSKFTDYNTGIQLPYAVSQATLSATSGPYALTSLYSTPPSNSAHYVTVMLNDRLAPHTRFNFNGRIGYELQDATFPANSADPNLSRTLGSPTYAWFANLNAWNQGTVNPSLDAKAFVFQSNISFATELAEHLEARIAYNLDGRDVSVREFGVWNASNPDQNANRTDYVVPQNWVKQTGTAELNYLILPESSTKITASYAFNNINRTNAQVEHSETHSFGLNVSSMLGRAVLARLGWEHSNRAGELHYGVPWGNLETGAPEEEGTPSGAYYQAPMVSDAITLRADYAPEGDLSGGLFVKFANNRFHYPAVESAATPTNSGNWSLTGFGQGITHNSTISMGPDINYRPINDLALHAYYSYERIYYDNRGNGACAENNTGACVGTAGYFQNKYTSTMHTAGFSGDWSIDDKLKLSGEYNFSYGSVLFGQFNGVAVSTVTASYQNVTNYPDIDSSMHDLKVKATYQMTDNIEAALIYRYSMFGNNDWQYVPVPVIPTLNNGTAISIVNAGYGPPDYNVSVVGMTFKVRL